MPRHRHRPTPPPAASPSSSQPLQINISSTNDNDPTNLRFEVDGTPYAPVRPCTRTRTRTPVAPAVTTPVAPAVTAPAPAQPTQVILPAHPRSTCRSLLASGLRRCHNLARLGHQTCWAHANTPAVSLVAEDGDYVTKSDSESESESGEEEEEVEEVVHRGRRRRRRSPSRGSRSRSRSSRRGSSVRFDLRVTTEEGEEARRGGAGRAERAEQRREDHDLDQADLVTGLYLGRVAGDHASRRRTREALDRLARVLRDWEI